MTSLIDFRSYPLNCVLKTLLLDKSTHRNIVFATKYHENCYEDSAITEEILLSLSTQYALQPRTAKALQQQTERTRKKAEVFTPSWLCAKMNGYCEEQLFNGVNPFFTVEGHTWHTNYEPIKFKKGMTWRQYVNLRWLELTCGEAPYLVSRYDATTGEPIPIQDRIGVLDRKLRVVNENANDEKEWHDYTKKAFQSVHGYEFQGDSLLIARINLLLTYVEHYRAKWGKDPSKDELKPIAIIIAWNIWQMDGLTGTVPFSAQEQEGDAIGFLFATSAVKEKTQIPCRVRNWSEQSSFPLNDLKEGKNNVKKFDFVIGNPPYDEETIQSEGSQTNGQAPRRNVFHFLQMSADSISRELTVLIYPAGRWIQRSGKGLASFGLSQINDKKLQYVYYYPNSKEVFRDAALSDGVSIVIKNAKKDTNGFKYVPKSVNLKSA